MGLLLFVATLAITVRYDRVLHGEHAAAAGLLLAGAGIVGLVVVRGGESELATAFLYPLRVFAVIPTILAGLATVVVVTEMPEIEGRIILGLFTAGMFFSTAVLLGNWYMIRLASRKYARKMMRVDEEASYT
jgi:hypothetical protein